MTTDARVAVIAGAGAAGAATALRLAQAGFVVDILDHDPAKAQALAEALRGDGWTAEGHGLDLLDVDSVQRWHDDLVDRHRRLDALVHLVGGWRGSTAFDLSVLANWQALHPRIVGTLATLTSVCAADIATSPWGRAVMVSSTALDRPTAGNTAYVAAKAAAEAWMAGLAAAFKDTEAASVVVRVKALVSDEMIAANPGSSWPGQTHVDDLAAAIVRICTAPAENGQRIDLTR